MDLEVESLQPRFYKQITKALDKGFLSHAYLIETNNNSVDVVKKYVLFLVEKIYEDSYKNNSVTIDKDKLFHLIENNEFPDYIEVYPINNQIKKEQLLFIKDEFANKSLYNTKKVYVVFDCEKMNVNSANTILKFLEEPSDDIVAIFVTSNQYNILDTIRSRCQVVRLQYEEKNDITFSDDLLEFVDDINNRKDNDLMLKFNYYNSNMFKDKSLATDFMRDLLKYFETLLNKKSSNDSLEDLVSIISILENELKKLKYNVNMKLWLDNLLLSLMEVLNEIIKDILYRWNV